MEYKNATVIKKANVYFDGKVTSRTVILESGERVTLGFMQPGSYIFNTGAAELMQVLAGDAQVVLLGETEAKTYVAGEYFSVPANSSFDIKITTFLDYCCSYAD